MKSASGEARLSGRLQAEAGQAQRESGTSEASLLVRLRADDDDAYEELLKIHGRRLLALARRLMHDEEDARDCLQNALLSAFRAIHGFEGKSRLGTWLHRIVVNACLMRLRSRKSRREERVDPQLPRFDDYGFRMGPTEITPVLADELLEKEEVRWQVRERIDRLPENYRTVLILRDIEEFNTVETAELLGLTRGAVKVRLHRARLALKDQFGDLFG